MRRHRAAVIEKRSAAGAAVKDGIADFQCGGATKVGTRVINGATRVSRVAAKCAVVDPQCGVSSKVAVIVDAAAAGGTFWSSGVSADTTLAHRYHQPLVVALFIVAADAAARSGGITWS